MSLFFTLLELHFSGLKSILFYPKDQKMFLSGFRCSKEQVRKRSFFFFEKNHGLTRWQNVDVFDFFRTLLFRFKKHSFLSRISKNVSSWFFWLKKKERMKKRSIFWEKPWTNPFAKCPFFSTSWELNFSGLKRTLYYPQYQKTFLYGFFLLKKNIWKKVDFFEKNHGLTPLQNVDILWLC